MIRKTVTILNPSGLQIDVAGAFCSLAMDYESKIYFKYRGSNEANAKSVLSILGAGIRKNENIDLICEGSDEEEAMDALCKLLSREE